MAHVDPGAFQASGDGPDNGVESLFPYIGLRERDLRRDGVILGEGRNVCRRLIESEAELISVLCEPRFADEFTGLCQGRCPVIVRSAGEMRAIVGFKFHRGVLAAAKRQSQGTLASVRDISDPVIVLCIGIATSENLGIISRTAAALGISTLVIDETCCDPLSRRVLKVSVGAILSQNVFTGGPVTEIRDHLHGLGYSLIGAVVDGAATPVIRLRTEAKVAVAFGTEATGLSDVWKKSCDRLVTIPMAGAVDSLNVGVAAGIILHHLTHGETP